MGKFTNLEALKKSVTEEGGVLAVQMVDLRDAIDQKKLGVHVRARITNEMAGLGLGHEPQELPEWQNYTVFVYKQGTKIAQVVEAVRAPSTKGAKVLRDCASDKAQEKLDEIRTILDEG